MPIRVLVVDDAVVMRRMITAALQTDPGIQVVGAAAHGRLALQMVSQHVPDVITLDVEMPELDGLGTVRALRAGGHHTPVIMCSALTTAGAEATLDALAAGANDWIAKPMNSGSMAEGIARLAAELVPRVRALARKTSAVATEKTPPAIACVESTTSATPELLVIATSTGGPNALMDLFHALTEPLTIPVVLVQHMPPVFTQSLAERLTRSTGHRCVEASDGQTVEPSTVYVAPGGLHTELVRSGTRLTVRLHDGPPENGCRPAADVLFRSAARVMGDRVVACVLTGMGQDGLRGCEEIRAAGGRVLAQDQESSVVWGMPGAVVHAGLADDVVPLAHMAGAIRRRLTARASTRAIA